MTVEQLKARFWAWYNRNFQAGWYASLAIIGGWLSAAIAWAPEGINFVVDHADYFGRFVVPSMDPETKAIFLSAYVTFVAPVLRAKIQNWMQAKAEKQKIEKQADPIKVAIADEAAAIKKELPPLLADTLPPKTMTAEEIERAKLDAGTHIGG